LYLVWPEDADLTRAGQPGLDRLFIDDRAN